MARIKPQPQTVARELLNSHEAVKYATGTIAFHDTGLIKDKMHFQVRPTGVQDVIDILEEHGYRPDLGRKTDDGIQIVTIDESR